MLAIPVAKIIFLVADNNSDVDAIVAWGTTEQITSRIKAHLDSGADHVCVQVLTDAPGTLPMKQWQELADATRAI